MLRFPNTQKVVIFDFDGTLTDPRPTYRLYLSHYLPAIVAVTGAPKDFIKRWREYSKQVHEHPERYPWVVDGVAVAEAEDFYIRINRITQLVLDHYQVLPGSHEERQSLIARAHAGAYRRAKPPLRPEVRLVLEACRKHQLWILTNSPGEEARRQLADAGLAWAGAHVVGDAQKFVVKLSDFSTINPSPLFPRPVYLDRPNYTRILRRLVPSETERLYVIGHAYTSDLSVPDVVFKAHIGLVPSAFTLLCTRLYIKRHPRGCLIQSLSHIPEWVATS